ncbi:MAG: ribonuclease R [Legionellales bacterium]|nr:ribonuclease R [Legionellales bacterium]OUX66352.1 MAG: ribonuclease R [Gammaproteobacteria bacterium TMED281]
MKDPFYLQEKLRYKNPVPSRELILKTLQRLKKPIKFDSLIKELTIEPKSLIPGFKKRIKAMIRDGQIMENRNGFLVLTQQMDLCQGIVQFNKDRTPFLWILDDNRKVTISGMQASELMQGDDIMARFVSDDEAIVVEILSRRLTHLIGTVDSDRGILSLKPLTICCQYDPLIKPSKFKLHQGQLVKAKIQKGPKPSKPAIVGVVELIKPKKDLDYQIDLICQASDIDVQYPEALVPKQFPKIDHREDWTALDFVTIDGEDAKDFDDAVYVNKTKEGYNVYVAIADVSHFVKPNSPLDKEARSRGTSVYFPSKVIPMLPEKLSNDWCSLRPDEDRLSLAIKINLNSMGHVKKSSIHQVTIRSKHRLTYHQVQNYIDKQNDNLSTISHIIDPLIEVYTLLQKLKNERGALTFNRNLMVPILSGSEIVGFKNTKATDATRLIEVLMLLANEEVAKFCKDHKLPVLYRNHGEPDLFKWQVVAEFLKQHNIAVNQSQLPTPKQMCDLLTEVADLEGGDIIEQMVLRSLPQALYEASCKGHYGLSYETYLHFTSPIRRYPDLVVHRAIKQFLLEKSPIAYDVMKIGHHCSYTERRAEQATRWIDSWLKCQYVKDKIGTIHRGKISNVLGFGVFVYLDDIGIDGLIHVSNLPQDYYDFNEKKQQLEGRYSKNQFTIGDQLKVRIDRVDLETRKIDFQLCTN